MKYKLRKWTIIWGLSISVVCSPIIAKENKLIKDNSSSKITQNNPKLKLRKKRAKALVMLAKTWDGKSDISGWWMSEKLDGVRAYWNGKSLISRSGKIFAAPKWFTEGFPDKPLDGELWIDRGKFNLAVSIINKKRKKSEDRWKNIQYYIFDAPDVEGGFEKRLDYVQKWFEEKPSPYAKVHNQEKCSDADHLKKRLKEIDALGGEGIMLRKPDSLYKIGRSSDMLKVKIIHNSKGKVVKHIPGKGKNKGKMGSLLIELQDGKQFRLGSGFSKKERENPPPVGSIITFKYQGFTKSGLPKYPSFIGVSEEL